MDRRINRLSTRIADEQIAATSTDLADSLEDNIDKFLCGLSCFDKEFIKQITEFSYAKEKLKLTISVAYEYTCIVDEFFHHGHNTDFRSIKRHIKSGNFRTLQDFFHRMARLLSKIGSAHDEFIENCDESHRVITECAELCAYLQCDARKQRVKTTLIGGVAGVGLLAVGGILCIGGYFALGAGFAVCGAATGAYTYVSASDLMKSERKFRLMSSKFQEMADYATEIKHSFNDLHRLIVRYEKSYDFLHNTKRRDRKTLCEAIDRLESILGSEHGLSSEASETLSALEDRFED